MVNLEKYEYLIFDLDNTIYDEKLYLFAAYNGIATDINLHFGIDSSAIFHFLSRHFETFGRKNIFDAMISKFCLPPSHIENCLYILRNVQLDEAIEIYPAILTLLQESIYCGKKIFVITNGNPEQQRNKLRSINWQRLDSNIRFILANDFTPKPSPVSFEQTNITENELSKSIFIGDSESDLEFAENVGIAFIHVNKLVQNG